MKIENLATTGTNSGTIMLLNGATNNILKYLHVVNFTQNTAGPRAIEISTSTSAGNSNNAIRYCKIEGGRSGIGLAGSTSYPNDSITISNCEIFNFGYAGIWILSAQLNTNIDSCKIYQTTGINSSIVSGIIMSTVAGGTYNIRKNWIYDLYTTSTSTSAALRGIYGSSVAAGSTVNLINNMVSNNVDNGVAATVTGFEFLGTNAYTLNMYYNTAKIGGTHSGSSTGQTSAGFRIGSSTQTLILNMKNNIAMNTRTGGNVNHCGFVMLGTGGTLNVDYNCYYSTGSNAYNVYWGGTGYNVLADYKTAVAPNEQNSVFTNVNFVSATDLHLTGSSNGDVNLKGTPVTGITIDYDNDLRHPVAPYKGADEGSILLGAKENLTAADSYHLSQNYPNPFNPVTKINFAIPKSGLVTMKIYDITGKEVATLVNDVKNAGNYIVDFNGADFSSGVYFYKLTSDDFTSVKKMMLIK